MSVDRTMIANRSTDDQDGLAVGPASDGGAGLTFWMMILLAIAVFAPCLVLPAWREYQTAELIERMTNDRVRLAEVEISNLRRELDAIHNDPAAVTRLARRELEYREPSDQIIAVPVSTIAGVSPQRQAGAKWQPTEPPVAISRLTRLLPHKNFDALFCDSPTRETLMAMSAGLFFAAFIVFWPRSDVGHESG